MEQIISVLENDWVVPIFSGLIATLLWWFLTSVVFAARIKFSNLQIYIGEDGLIDYYINVGNKSHFKKIYNVECYCIITNDETKLVYLKDSRLFKFTALGPQPSVFRIRKKMKNEFEGNVDQIVQQIPYMSFLLINSLIYSEESLNGEGIDFSRPINDQQLKDGNLSKQNLITKLRENVDHTLFMVIQTTVHLAHSVPFQEKSNSTYKS